MLKTPEECKEKGGHKWPNHQGCLEKYFSPNKQKFWTINGPATVSHWGLNSLLVGRDASLPLNVGSQNICGLIPMLPLVRCLTLRLPVLCYQSWSVGELGSSSPQSPLSPFFPPLQNFQHGSAKPPLAAIRGCASHTALMDVSVVFVLHRLRLWECWKAFSVCWEIIDH